jgi:AraC-like DNA-binding protein
MTIEQIAEEAACGISTIQKYVKRYNLPDRPYRTHEKNYANVLTEEYLTAAYLEESLTAQEIAADAGCSVTTVVRHLELCGIDRRGTRPGVDNLLYEEVLTPECLRRRLEERANVNDIAREAGCSTTAAHLALRRHGLGHLISPIRPPEPPCATAGELRRMFVDEKMSMNAIGRALGVSKTKVRADLSRFGIRPYSRPGFRATDDAWAE